MSNIKRIEKLEYHFFKAYMVVDEDLDKELSEFLKDRPPLYFLIQQDDPNSIPERLSKAFFARIDATLRKNKLEKSVSGWLKLSSDDWKWIHR